MEFSKNNEVTQYSRQQVNRQEVPV